MKNILDDANNANYSYLRYEDVSSAMEGACSLAIKAPLDTTMQVPIPDLINNPGG